MSNRTPARRWSITLVATLLSFSSALTAEKGIAAEKDREISLSDGKIKLQAPKSWEKKQPTVKIIDYEFAAPKAEGDAADGRLTVMGAGGSVDQNIDRWLGQFTQPDNKSTRDRSKIEKIKINGQEVHTVDLSGTFKDQKGPFAPAVMREDYRMLGAIVATEKHGQYFLKLYGPKKTIAAHEKAFHEMLGTLKVE